MVWWRRTRRFAHSSVVFHQTYTRRYERRFAKSKSIDQILLSGLVLSLPNDPTFTAYHPPSFVLSLARSLARSLCLTTSPTLVISLYLFRSNDPRFVILSVVRVRPTHSAHSSVRTCVRACLLACVRACSLTGLQKLAPRLVGILIPFVIVAGNTAERSGSASESYVTATTTTATIHTRQSVRIAQWLLGEGLVSPVALEATLRFPLVLVTPVKFSFTCYRNKANNHRHLRDSN